ncbi:MAG: T9SS type A sorting domain-containing protein [Flavobacteriales bacterium]|nr:T9SS type A sorting domain-containing protein [Flavobacteriales bacterium]
MMHSAHFRIPILATLLLPALLTAQTSFYAVTSPVDGMGRLVQVDILTGSESNVLPVSLNDDQVEGCTGMALDPVSGDVFVLAKVGSETRLATIDLGTGVLTERATFTEKFAGIVFDATGTLYGITGDGSNTPETLYTIDPFSGALVLAAQPGTGSDGEAIAFNPDNGLLYRYGGDNIFQSIVPGTGAVTDIFTNGASIPALAHALVYNGGSFVLSAETSIFQVSQSGTTVLITDLPGDHPGYKGLVSVEAVGIHEHRAAAPSIFPNPASDNITISVPEGRIDRVRVFAANGDLVLEKTANAVATYDLDVRSLPAGGYVLEVGQNGSVRNGRFMVMH